MLDKEYDTSLGNPEAVYETLPDFLNEALSKPETTDICINPDGTVFLYAHGHAGKIGDMKSHQILAFLRKAARWNRRPFTEETPIFSGILPHNERIEAYSLAVSPDGLSATIRKPGPLWTLDDLYSMAALSSCQLLTIKDAAPHKSIVVSGIRGGSGKTTMVRAILEEERVKHQRRASIESDLELQAPINGVRLRAGVASFSQLFASALRGSHERIIVSEVRTTAEAMALVDSMRTGHIGLSTVHSATPLMAAQRLLELGKEVGGIPVMDIAACMEVVIHMARDSVRGRHVATIERIFEKEGSLMSEPI